jgi:hypothetical protein
MRLTALNAPLVDDNTAIVLTKAAVGGEGSLNYDKFQTSLLIRRDGQWMIAAAQGTAMSDRSKERYHRDPNG